MVHSWHMRIAEAAAENQCLLPKKLAELRSILPATDGHLRAGGLKVQAGDAAQLDRDRLQRKRQGWRHR